MNRDKMIEYVRKTSLLRGDFVLSGGGKSDYYIDKYAFLTQPEILEEIGEQIVCYVGEVGHEVDRFAGLELGGAILAAAASLACGKPFVLVRRAAQQHGTMKRVEGILDKGDSIMLIDDIATTGMGLIGSACAIEEAGGIVAKVVVVVDRLEGAREHLSSAGYEFESLMTIRDIKHE